MSAMQRRGQRRDSACAKYSSALTYIGRVSLCYSSSLRAHVKGFVKAKPGLVLSVLVKSVLKTSEQEWTESERKTEVSISKSVS